MLRAVAHAEPDLVSRALHMRVGLFVCRALVQAMDGRIRGQERARGGAQSSLTLPISDEE